LPTCCSTARLARHQRCGRVAQKRFELTRSLTGWIVGLKIRSQIRPVAHTHSRGWMYGGLDAQAASSASWVRSILSTARGHHRCICPAQQVRQLGGVGDRLVPVAVVYARLGAALTCVSAPMRSGPVKGASGSGPGCGAYWLASRDGWVRRPQPGSRWRAPGTNDLDAGEDRRRIRWR
jgi:hypothetical protein